MSVPTLSPADRTIFREVAATFFSNPFSDERSGSDLRIAQLAEGAPPEKYLAVAVEQVHRRVAEYRHKGRAWREKIPAEDRDLLRHASLFDLYHRHPADWDALIRRQEEAGAEPVAAPFAARLAEEIFEAGFRRDEAFRFLALIYQLRRAFHFIGHTLAGRSRPIRRLRMRLWQNVFTHDLRSYERHLAGRLDDFTTLLLGETGTGKGAAAAAIGRSGLIPFDERHQRFAASFAGSIIELNLAQFPETLIESELFGHRKGAFAGAINDHDGAFARCRPFGAIFLDEIGGIPPRLQVSLLRALQERSFTPVGAREPIRSRGRVIAATHLPIERLRAAGRFRDDLFFRLTSDVIPVPTLRERLSDNAGELDDLLPHIVARLLGVPEPDTARHITRELRRTLPPNYPWPGNLRELEQAVHRFLLTGAFTPHAPAQSPAGRLDHLQNAVAAGTLTADALLAEYCALLHEQHGSYQNAARAAGLDWRTLKAHALRSRRFSESPAPQPL